MTTEARADRPGRGKPVVEAVVLCGGLGTRLQTVVSDRPKPMAEFGDRPFLALLLDFLHSQGVRRFILAAGHKAGRIEEFFAGRTLPYETVLSIEKEPMGTGGALLLARSHVRRHPTAVLNGDSFCEVDLRRMLSFHVSREAAVTMAVTRARPVGEYGEVLFDANGSIRAFTEKGNRADEGWVNAGVYLFSDRALNSLPGKVPSSLERDFFPSCAGQGLFAFTCQSPLLDIGTPDRLAKARAELSSLVGHS